LFPHFLEQDLWGTQGLTSHNPPADPSFRCCTSLLARLEFPVQEILRLQSGHVPESNCHRGVCPAREQSGVGNEIQNDWIGGLMFALGASLSVVPGVAREKNPERKCLFRGNHPPSYQMVDGCLDVRQPYYRSGRWVQVLKLGLPLPERLTAGWGQRLRRPPQTRHCNLPARCPTILIRPSNMPKLDWLTRPEDERVSALVPYRLLEAVPELVSSVIVL
jgi:hypothetical protein